MSSRLADCLVVVQCRFGSSRLPGKALYPLAGLPMVAFLLRRLNAAGLGAPLVLATTGRPEDDPVAAWGRAEGVPVFRGPGGDVLARYTQCAAQFGARYLVRVTADNPLTHPGAVADCLAALAAGGCDHVDALGGYPYGAGADGFSLEHLNLVAAQRPENRYHEHLNAFALDFPHRVKSVFCPAPAGLVAPDLRLTVDTRQDWQRMVALLQGAGERPWEMSLAQAIAKAA